MPVKLMTSPGLIDRSISSTKPLTKFAAMLCRPKPRPMPIAPVSTLSVVRSRPAALRPTSTDRPTRNAWVNLAMPMRMFGARPSSFSTWRSSQRETHIATTTNRLTVTSSFATDQTEIRVLPAFMPIPSSRPITVSPQPSRCSDRNAQSTKLIAVPQPFSRARAPSETRST